VNVKDKDFSVSGYWFLVSGLIISFGTERLIMI